MKVSFNKYRELDLQDSEKKAQEFLDRLNRESVTAILKANSVVVDSKQMKNEDEQRAFLEALDWFVKEVKAT